jgi:beta-ureidopropionase / N-carbamoyl-L-amino-acid hydrolase
MPTINPERLLTDLRTLRSFGSQGTGVVRPSLSPADIEARHWLCGRMQEAGLDAHIDGVGNVIGRSRNAGKALLIGSHSDTQPTGGWLDGALGVVYALEVVRACAEDAHTRHLAIDPVAWIDEENTFVSCLGSRAYCGLLKPGEQEAARNREGVALTDAWRKAGLDGVPTQVEPGRYLGYLEAHIEQGAYLENDGKHIGVVTAIVGSRNFTVRFQGQQNHAGTTPMPVRQDAGMALIDFAYHVNQAFQQLAGPRTVWTIGRVEFHPGAASIIPGRAEMHLQFRDPEQARLEAFEAKTAALIAEANRHGPVAVTLEAASNPIQPTGMDPSFQQHIAAAAEQHAPGKWQYMPSAAIHDAMFLAQVMPAGMLFVPSINGISHDFAENTSDEDIVRGCQVMATSVVSILTEVR